MTEGGAFDTISFGLLEYSFRNFSRKFRWVDMYGVNGPHHIFTRIDASRALSKMFDEADVSSSDVSDLNDQQRTTLNE